MLGFTRQSQDTESTATSRREGRSSTPYHLNKESAQKLNRDDSVDSHSGSFESKGDGGFEDEESPYPPEHQQRRDRRSYQPYRYFRQPTYKSGDVIVNNNYVIRDSSERQRIQSFISCNTCGGHNPIGSSFCCHCSTRFPKRK